MASMARQAKASKDEEASMKYPGVEHCTTKIYFRIIEKAIDKCLSCVL